MQINKIKKSYIITIGDELLIGQVVNSNSSWMAEKLTNLGIKVIKMLTVQDEESAIIDALEEAGKNSDYVFISGGLGPTIDDITKRTIAKFLKVEMEFNMDFFEKVKTYIEKRGVKLDEMMYNYSFFPVGIKYLNNAVGTAPGMSFIKEDCKFYSLPGVPSEMKSIFTLEILPMLICENQDLKIVKKTILTAGEMEATLADRLKYIVSQMPENVSIAYLPNLGRVRIRITSQSDDHISASDLNRKFIKLIEDELGDIIYGYDDDIFEQKIGNILKEKNLKLCTAESCTGGNVAAKVTSISGSSDYFNGSIVAYSNDVKKKILKVNELTLEKYGAVSEKTVLEMAAGALEVLNADVSIATSGIAGPTGGTSLKPVGTIWIACGTKDKILTEKLQLGEDRNKNIETSSILVLNKLRRFILENF